MLCIIESHSKCCEYDDNDDDDNDNDDYDNNNNNTVESILCIIVVSTQPNTYTRIHILHTRRTCIRHIVLCNVDHTVIYDAIPFIIINYILLSAARDAVDGLKNNKIK